jgi:hypothetical protein
MLSQQEKSNSEDVQRGRVNMTGFICRAEILPSRRYTFGEFEPLAVPSRRHWRMFQEFPRRLRLLHKTSA